VIFCDLQLARRLEAAEAGAGVGAARALARLRPESGAAFESIAGGWAIFGGRESPITQAFCIGLHGPVSDEEMDRLEAFFDSRGAACNVEHCPHADGSVARHYARRGYHPIEFSNTLFRQLSPREVLPPLPDGVEVRPVGLAETDLWAETVCRGFSADYPVTPELLETVSCFAQNPATACFLAFVREKPAGGAAVCLHEGVGVVNGASTLPEFRKRGVQRALLLARLTHAIENGCDLAMTNTQPGTGSQRNVERIGFRVAHSRTKFHLPRKSGKG
jgi:GNAT superfamily N-acetyltransferase